MRTNTVTTALIVASSLAVLGGITFAQQAASAAPQRRLKSTSTSRR